MEVLTIKEYNRRENKPDQCIVRNEDPILGAVFCIIKNGRICQTAMEMMHGSEDDAIAFLQSIPEDEIG